VPGGVSRDGQFKVIPAILWLIERLAAHHEVHVVVPRQEARRASWQLRGATVWNLGGSPRAWQARAVRALLALHRERGIDVFHAIWAAGPGEAVVTAARLCGRPSLVHVAGGELVWLPEVPFGNPRRWRQALARRVLRWATTATAASRPMIDLIRSFAGVEALRVPLGVDTRFWVPEPPRARPPGSPLRIVSVASLTPVKDHGTLLHAAAELVRDGVDARVDLVGLDTSRGRIPTLVQSLGLQDHVRMHGFLPQDKARAVVQQADLMVVSSRHEAGPVAMLEAAALGVPTLGTPVGHVAEWAPLAAGVVPFADVAALRDALRHLAADDSRRLAVAREAQARSLAEDADWTADRFQELYKQATSSLR